MKLLITGHRGFIGGALIKTLSQYHEVTGYDYQNNFPNIKGYDWVIHAGAISSTTERDIDLILRQNLEFSCRLLEACYRYGVNLQYSSSASIYGLRQDFKETALPDPRTPYAWSKYLFERHVAQNPGPVHVQGFRYFNVFGTPDMESHKGSQASPHTQFRIQAELYGKINLFKNSASRDFVPVKTVVDMHEKFLRIPESGLWNIGTGKSVSFAKVAEEIALEKNCDINLIDMPKELEHSYQYYTCANLEFLNETLEKYNELD
jgi:ADP-L-glycero-D-manno-heptose 6-epimerase